MQSQKGLTAIAILWHAIFRCLWFENCSIFRPQVSKNATLSQAKHWSRDEKKPNLDRELEHTFSWIDSCISFLSSSLFFTPTPPSQFSSEVINNHNQKSPPPPTSCLYECSFPRICLYQHLRNKQCLRCKYNIETTIKQHNILKTYGITSNHFWTVHKRCWRFLWKPKP